MARKYSTLGGGIMRKMTMMLLSTALVIGFAGCGATSSSTTVAISEDSVPVYIQEAEEATSAITPETGNEEPEEAPGMIFTLPVPTASEMLSGAELDDYLANAKVNYQDYIFEGEVRRQFDMDGFMEACGYEYAGGFDEPPCIPIAGWFISRNGIDYAYCMHDGGIFSIYAYDGVNGAVANDLVRTEDNKSERLTPHYKFFSENGHFPDSVTMTELKAGVAVALYIAFGDGDLSKLPITYSYRLEVLDTPFIVDRNLDFLYDINAIDAGAYAATEYIVYD